MNNVDLMFFNEYQAVERICKDIYGDESVKAYINTMENCNRPEKTQVPNWYKKLKTLKHLKWLRNQIIHPNGPYEVTGQDIADIKSFHNELLTYQDPLTLLRKEVEKTNRKQQEQKRLEMARKQTLNNSSGYQKPKENDSTIIAILAAVSAIVVIIAIAFLLLH